LRSPHAVLDRAALQAELAGLDLESKPEHARRTVVLDILKRHLKAGRAEVRRRFYDEGVSGVSVMRATCYLVDELLRALHDHASFRLYPLANPSTGERLSLVAVGGYGRGELAPHSDIDLLFLLPYKMTPHSEQVVEEMLYFLWDLGFKVGHATRSVDDCLRQAKADITIRTNLLEARWIWGDHALYQELRERYENEVQADTAAQFIEAKLHERDERHKRLGDSRYQLEPNIKEGKGGLRDLSTLFWIAKYVYRVDDAARLVDLGVFAQDEAKRFEKAQNFLWTLRCHLHLQTGRSEERLTFDMQKQIAGLMGYHDHAGSSAVERFMKHYYLVAKDVGELTRIVCAQLETEHRRRARFRLPTLKRRRSVEGFKVEGDRLSVSGPEPFREQPIKLLKIFATAQKHDLDIHPRALRWIAQSLRCIDRKLRADPKANALFMEMLTSPKDPETTLRRMNEAGVLGRFLPDFGRIVAQMQYNMYHHYTVDEHTIFAIGVLHRIEQGLMAEETPISSEAIHKVHSRRALYLAVLLHDIGKGRAGDHSEVGEQIALKLGPRLGLSEEEVETTAWLVRHHLDMSAVAFKRDLEEPKTIQDFAANMQSMERLRLLLCLTVADIRAVGPGTWNDWKAALLRDLYWHTEEELAGGFHAEARDLRVKRAKQALAERLADWTPQELEAHMTRGYPSYWLGWDTDTHERHARIIRRAECEDRPLTVETRVDTYRGVAEIIVYTADHAGLFSRIAGALAVAGASISAARIFTLKNGMALDTFWVRDAQGGPFDRPDRLARVSSVIERVLAGRLNPMHELAKRRSSLPSRYTVFKVPPRVLIDNKISDRHTVIEVNGRDRPGLLYELTRALSRLNVMIHGAKISTFGERVVDVFYVQAVLGGKVEGEAKLRRIRQRLAEVLTDPECRPAKPPKAVTEPVAETKAATGRKTVAAKHAKAGVKNDTVSE
jgi:[protein-PII] uridylyltransferase